MRLIAQPRRDGVDRRILRSIEVSTLVVLVALPIIADDFTSDRVGSLLIYALFAVSLDLIWGFGGMLSFGHAIFFGWAAYAFVYITQGGLHLNPLLALVLAPILTGGLGYLLGVFSFSARYSMHGIYFSVITFGLAITSTALALAGGTFTGGQSGILIDYRLQIGGWNVEYGTSFYVFSLVILVLIYVAVRVFVRSRFGLVLQGIRGDEGRIGFYGYNTARVKRWALAGSAAIAGLAGELFSIHNGIVSPTAAGIDLSILACVWILLGGAGTLIGGVIIAIVLSYFELEMAGSFASTWPLFVSALLVLVVTFARGGLLGSLESFGRRRAVRG